MRHGLDARQLRHCTIGSGVSGFLPSEHQGTLLQSHGDPVLFLSNPAGVSPEARRRMLDALSDLNRKTYESVGDPETHARISQYEMAFRMQSSVPELSDLSKEPDYIFDMYGPDARKPGTFAYSCILARRLVERGVRLTQIFHRGWDQHGQPAQRPADPSTGHRPARHCLDPRPQATAACWTKRWSSGAAEFGRTVYCQGQLTEKNYGRDHHPKCFTILDGWRRDKRRRCTR